MGKVIDISWYQNNNVVDVATGLLGKHLCTNINGKQVKGLIVETEAYSGDNDKACHANNQRKTKRNQIMFEPGGHAYIYLCYGIHHLFNVVTNVIGKADAVLIRAVEPLEGVEAMLDRRKMGKFEKQVTNGPGKFTQAFGITTQYYGTALDSKIIWIEESKSISENNIIAAARIGVGYAEEDALKPWRFYLKENKWVSRF